MEASYTTYPEMSLPLLETVMRLTIDKVKTQRAPPPPTPQSQTPRPPTVGDEQSQRPVPFARSKSTSLLRTLLIIQIGRKTSRLLSLVSQPETYQPAKSVEQAPQHPPTSNEEPQSPSTQSGKRRSSDDEELQSDLDEIPPLDRPTFIEGPSSEKVPCLENINEVIQVPSKSEETFTPVRGMNQLSIQTPTNGKITYDEGSCPGCQQCSMWMQHQQRQDSSNFHQLCEPVKQC